jgi:hypothetical protein
MGYPPPLPHAHHHSYAYHGSGTDGEVETNDDASEVESHGGPSSSRRDSYSYYYTGNHNPHHYVSTTANATASTPLQPPPYLYNGPPVSALVPRMARQNHHEQVAASHSTAVAFTPPYDTAPNSALADSNSSRHISFLNSLPMTTESERAACASRDNENEMGSHNGQHISSNRDDRRTSFGFPITSQFLIPTPQLRPPKTDPDEQSLAVSHDDESMTIPPPPISGKLERADGAGALEDCHGSAEYDDSLGQRSLRPCASSSSNGSSGRDASSPNPLQESQRLNMGGLQFEPNVLSTTTTTQKNLVTTSSREPAMSGNLEKKAAPTMHDASLLLGLRTDLPITTDANPNNHSPTSTVPDMQDEMDDTPPNPHNRSSHHSSDVAVAAVPHTVTAATTAAGLPLAAGTTTDAKTLAELPKTCFPAPVPKKYPRTLSLPNDSIKLNALHCFIRAELLEIFVVEPSPEHLKFRHAPSSAVGRVGLRCVHCAQARTNSMNASRDDEAPMAVFYPKSVHEIYRLVTSWQRCHVRKCKSLPPSVRNVWKDLRETEKSRGKTAYWADAARQIGLVDCPSRAGGIRFDLAVVAQLEFEDNEDMVATSTVKEEKELGVDENVLQSPAAASSKPDAADTLLPPAESSMSKGNGLLLQPNYMSKSFAC